MATDLESGVEHGEAATARPSLKIVGLHIRGLKSIASLDLPEDGLGWDGPIPDFVMVGGINGSGKTTLLEFLAGVFFRLGRDLIRTEFEAIAPEIRAKEARTDLRLTLPGVADYSVRLLVGDSKFIDDNASGAWFGVEYGHFLEAGDARHDSRGHHKANYNLKLLVELPPRVLDRLGCPSLVYFPSERRALISPPTNRKFAGKLIEGFALINRWNPPQEWDDSLEARLYGVRWEDLNAKEEGRDRTPKVFAAYEHAFARFFEGRKHLKWYRGELVVETKNGVTHDLSELSSGEKQVILFMGELLHRWRPGSLILIDEPELHLHESYQTRLWEALVDWQKERGGQVIVATQSDHLFRLAGTAMKVLLSRRSR